MPPSLRLDPANKDDHVLRIRLFSLRRDLVLGERLFATWLRLQDLTPGWSFEQFITQELETKFFVRGLQEQVTTPCSSVAPPGAPGPAGH